MARKLRPIANSCAITVACTLLNAATPLPAASVYSFGANYDGRSGVSSTDGHSLTTATRIDESHLGGRTVIEVAGGGAHSLLLADDGSVFSFGSNEQGQTGMGTDVGNTLAAMPIDASNLGGRKIMHIAAGTVHSLLLAEDGVVFAFGSNEDGRTGLGTDSGTTLAPVPIDASLLGGRKIVQVSAGWRHSLLLAEDGSVFAMGNNDFGLTGVGTDAGLSLAATPVDASNLGGRKVGQVSAGLAHSLLLTEDGGVFAFGSNAFGMTGMGATAGYFTPVPTPINASNLGGRKITQVDAENIISLLLSEDGTVFSMGGNVYGNTGQGTRYGDTLIATPIVATNIGDLRITQIAAGYGHSVFLAEDGSVFTCGLNGNGQTGLGRDHGYTEVPTRIEPNRNLGVSQVAAGSGHTLLVALVPEPRSFVLLLIAATLGQPSRLRSLIASKAR